MSATEPTFRVQGTYTDNAGKQQTVSAKVKAQSESQAKKKAQNSLSKKYKNLQVSQTEKLSEGVDQQLGTYTIVHGTADPVHREERLYTIVENVTKEQARKLAQDNLPKSEQDRYIIETTEGKYVPNGHKPNYVNPVKQQQDKQKKQQKLDESLKRNVEQDNDTGHQWRHASLYEDVDRSRMLHLAGVKGKSNRSQNQTLNEATATSGRMRWTGAERVVNDAQSTVEQLREKLGKAIGKADDKEMENFIKNAQEAVDQCAQKLDGIKEQAQDEVAKEHKG